MRLRNFHRSPGDDPLAIWRKAADLGMPVSAGGPMEGFLTRDFAGLVESLPHLKVVIEHLGGMGFYAVSDYQDARPSEAHYRQVLELARNNRGYEALAQAIESYSQAQLGPRVSSERRRAIARWRIVELLRESLLARVLASDSSVAMLNRLADEVATRQRDPYSAVEEIIRSAES